MTGASPPTTTADEARELLAAIGWRPDWTEAELTAATSRFGPMKFDRVKRAIAIVQEAAA